MKGDGAQEREREREREMEEEKVRESKPGSKFMK
jgi:hypothetical protein